MLTGLRVSVLAVPPSGPCKFQLTATLGAAAVLARQVRFAVL